NPKNGKMIVVEMNPRVSRSSALASKATGFPIAKIATKLACGYTLDELPNDITRETPACFEPTIDYCVTKIPRWTFEKFPEADETLGTQMKSVGEAMSIGRTFKESLQKGIRSMEVKRYGLGLDGADKWLSAKRGETTGSGEPIDYPIEESKLNRKLSVPSQGRMYYIRYALKMGMSVEEVCEKTMIDPWFIVHLKELVDFEDVLEATSLEAVDEATLREAKELGYSDIQLSTIWQACPDAVRAKRKALGIEPVYKLVDTCSAEFEAATPYYYSTYETPLKTVDPATGEVTEFVDDEVRVTDKNKIVILGGGPNRIGQGIEFDYCCVHAAFAAQELGYEAVMVNSNPETVSTDYDTSDLLFFEPLTLEDVLNICERLNGAPLGEEGLLHGVIVHLGGQTPLNLARGLEAHGVPIIGTSPESIDLAEDRERFGVMIDELKLQCPPGSTAYSVEDARKVAAGIGYPVLVRPSYVLGGRAMEIVSDEQQLDIYMTKAVDASTVGRDHPILVDKFLDNATEVDVDCLSDYGLLPDGSKPTNPMAIVCGVLEHIEEAGIHSGDSACAIPPYSLTPEIIAEIKRQAYALAERLMVRGLMNIQFAVKDGEVYIIEVNPRASRTVPFVSKATAQPWAKLAAKVMAGCALEDLGAAEVADPPYTSVKESVFPFTKFPGVDVVLGPEMRSTGEVMGIDTNFGLAFGKGQMAASTKLPTSGTIFLSVFNLDQPIAAKLATQLVEMGFEIVATEGTARALTEANVPVRVLPKISEGRPNILDLIKNGEVDLILNTPTKRGPQTDEGKIRAMATLHQIPLITTITGAEATVKAIAAFREGGPNPDDNWTVRPLQDYYANA
ncbi:MAG: carbamoyl-phosphate synthase large subunit, partial [Phycisphaerales bacterium]|nr:carbamoyl-phosphate synthase large subunit [Phycisphaerales bacterium]